MERRQEMPLLLRYFALVVVRLIALLFVSNAYFPKLHDQVRADSELPVIRIPSDRKWPERVVFDTNRPTIVPAAAAANTLASAPVPAAAGEASAQARARNSFAQLQPPQQKQAQLTEPKKPGKPGPRKRTIATRHVAPPALRRAPPPHFILAGSG